MYAVRLWSVRNARVLERAYALFERTLWLAAPLIRRIGYERVEKPVAFVERNIKGVLFDCGMCGQCALSDTGMSCPTNCPKNLRNGPCGGVRANGNCEVKPEMRCVWVEAVAGDRRTKGGDIMRVREPRDFRLLGASSWIGVLKDREPLSPENAELH